MHEYARKFGILQEIGADPTVLGLSYCNINESQVIILVAIVKDQYPSIARMMTTNLTPLLQLHFRRVLPAAQLRKVLC